MIGACLGALTADARPGELEIVVVCNGCTDSTAAVARSFEPAVRTIETPVASKSLALRLGDHAATAFPRLYVDADVLMSAASVRAVAARLREGAALAAAPRIQVDLSAANRAVRAYYAVWTRLPYHLEGMIGSGVYAVSKEGRERFGEFPDLISDDGFVRLHFAPQERESVADASFSIRAPERLRDLIRIKVRSQKGAIQLARRHPELLRNDPRSYAPALGNLLRDPRMWLPCLVYAAVIGVTKAQGYRLNYVGDLDHWERDDSSRAGIASPPPRTR